MSTTVVMPQMGESIAEGTIVRWIKKVGETVDRDEPLFEISTDKVDAEIPSPAAGVLLDIAVKEGETVPINTVVATIGAAGTSVAAPVAPSSPSPPSLAQNPSVSSGEVSQRGTALLNSPAPVTEAVRQKSSPLVRRIAGEHGVDIAQIAGSGTGGRVTKQDILGFLDRNDPPPQPSSPMAATGDVEIQPMSLMRRKIAEHMVLSQRTSAHVYSVFEVNYTRVEQIRQARKADYEHSGAKLTYTAFIAKVVIDCLTAHRLINASIDGDNILLRREVNLGVAVALDNGLIVPVVKQAGEKSLLGLARAIQDVADRARAKKLSPDEVHGGTFTITNPGTFGAQFGLPIINQPQVAILGVGTIEKRAVVIDDLIGIRLMGFLTLGYDHRLVDGATADRFMADVKKGIENFDPAAA